MYPGSTVVCVSKVHVLKISGAHNVYPGSTAVCISMVHVFNDTL